MKCLFPQYCLFPIVPQLDVSMVINFPKDDSYKEKLVQKFVGHFHNHFDYKLVKGHKLSHAIVPCSTYLHAVPTSAIVLKSMVQKFVGHFHNHFDCQSVKGQKLSHASVPCPTCKNHVPVNDSYLAPSQWDILKNGPIAFLSPKLFLTSQNII
jgi:hypothetical protein